MVDTNIFRISFWSEFIKYPAFRSKKSLKIGG